MSTPFSSELQRIASTGWGFVERGYLGEWELRAPAASPPAPTPPGRSATRACRWPRRSEAVRAWFAERGLPPKIAVVAGSELDGRLAGPRVPGGRVPGVPPDGGHRRRPGGRWRGIAVSDRAVEFSPDTSEDYFASTSAARVSPPGRPVLTSGGADLTFAVIRDEAGEPIAVGRLATDPCPATSAWRRPYGRTRSPPRTFHHGSAGPASARVRQRGAQRLSGSGYENVPALALYERLGFVTEHCYHSRTEVDGREAARETGSGPEPNRPSLAVADPGSAGEAV